MYMLKEQNENGEWVTISITTREEDIIGLLKSRKEVDKKDPKVVDTGVESV